MRILVPLDGSPLSERALDVTKTLAQALRAEVVLFTVSETAETSRHAEQIRADTEEQLGRAAAKLGDITVHRRVDTGGEPARGILEAVRDLEADHIVMTTHGRSGLTRLAQGSVAEEVLREAPVPVTMIRPADDGA